MLPLLAILLRSILARRWASASAVMRRWKKSLESSTYTSLYDPMQTLTSSPDSAMNVPRWGEGGRGCLLRRRNGRRTRAGRPAVGLLWGKESMRFSHYSKRQCLIATHQGIALKVCFPAFLGGNIFIDRDIVRPEELDEQGIALIDLE